MRKKPAGVIEIGPLGISDFWGCEDDRGWYMGSLYIFLRKQNIFVPATKISSPSAFSATKRENLRDVPKKQ